MPFDNLSKLRRFIPHYRRQKFKQQHKTAVEVHMPETHEALAEWANNNLTHDSVLGFDCEWRPKFTPGALNRVALVQLATKNSVALIQMHKFASPPAILKQLLLSRQVVKTGVGVLEDLKKLRDDHGLDFANYQDLGAAAQRFFDATEMSKFGLANMIERAFGVTVDKPRHVQMSNWEAKELNSQQITYASLDALMGRDLYDHFLDVGVFEKSNIYRALDEHALKTLINFGGRYNIRHAFLFALENDEMMCEMGRRIVLEDEKVISIAMETQKLSNLINKGTTTTLASSLDSEKESAMAAEQPSLITAAPIDPRSPQFWRTMAARLFSRLSYVTSLDTHSRTQGKGITTVCIRVHCQERVLAEAIDSTQALAKERACRQVVLELFDLQKSIATSHPKELLEAYSGKTEGNSATYMFEDWLRQKKPKGES